MEACSERDSVISRIGKSSWAHPEASSWRLTDVQGSGLGTLSFIAQGHVYTIVVTAVLQSPQLPSATNETPNKGSAELVPPGLPS